MKPKSLSSSLNGLPRMDTIEGFVSENGKLHCINSEAEFERTVNESRTKMEAHWTSTSADGYGEKDELLF